MIPLNQIVYDIKMLMSGEEYSDDNALDNRQIRFWIKTQRAVLIRNELNKNRTIDPDIIQNLGCISLIVADRAECCNLSSDCTILKTNIDIPSPIELHHQVAITRVGPIDLLAKAFSFVPYQQAVFSGNGRFTQNEYFAYYINKRIYIKVRFDKSLKIGINKINVQGVFEDPEEASAFKLCSGEPCYTSSSSYPIKGWMIDYMKNQIINSNVKLINMIPSDKTNDAKISNTSVKT